MKRAKGKEHKEQEIPYSQASNLWYWLRFLYRESPGFVWLYGLEVVFAIAISLLGVYLPSVLVADITEGRNLGMLAWHLAWLGGGLVCLYVASNYVEQTKKEKNKEIGYRRILQIARASMEAPYSRIENARFQGEFWQQLRRNMWEDTYTTGFMGAFSKTVQALIGMLLYVGMLSGLSPWILLLVMAGTAVNYIVGYRCNQWDAANRHKWMNLDRKTHYLAQELGDFQAAKDVRLYGMAPWLKEMYDRYLGQRVRYTVRMQANYFLESLTGGATRMVWEAAAYLYLIWLVCEGRLDAAGFVLYFGVITGFATWCGNIVGGMRQLHQNALYVGEDRRFMERLAREVHIENAESEKVESEKAGTCKGKGTREAGKADEACALQSRQELVLPAGHLPEIAFVHVTFRYEGEKEPVIQDLDLVLHPGENIALVGCNGAGKTTFVKLLCGFYDPTEGEIRIDGVNRDRYTRSSWLRIFSGVFQEVGLFPLSLLENLVPEGQVQKELLDRCLEEADLQKVIEKLPDGLESMLGKGVYESAVDFSGGETQKLMLARALYKQAPLLVLDEPTAALDPLMESQLYEQYQQFSKDRTTVFISHRLASTRFCHRVLLMEHGRVIEAGSHEELLGAQGRYAELFQIQSRYYRWREVGMDGGEQEEVGDLI